MLMALATFTAMQASGQSLVQSVFECNQNSVTTKVCTIPTSITAHSTILITANINADLGTTINLSVNNSDTAVQVGSVTVAGGGNTGAVFIIKDANAGSTAYTLSNTTSTSTNYQSYAYEISGLNNAFPVSQHAENSGNSTTMTPCATPTPCSSGVVTTATKPLFLWYFDATGTNCTTVTGTGSSGWTLAGSSQSFAQNFYILSATAGTYNPTCSVLTGLWTSGIISLNPTGTGTPIAAKHKATVY